MAKIYGYVRISTPKQNIERQIRNIRAAYPSALIVQDEYTGTKMTRPNWTKLYHRLNDGDMVIFDSVSRMSRDAEDGFAMGFCLHPYSQTSSLHQLCCGPS